MGISKIEVVTVTLQEAMVLEIITLLINFDNVSRAMTEKKSAQNCFAY